MFIVWLKLQYTKIETKLVAKCLWAVISSREWQWLWLFVDSYVQNNQLKDLPQDIFRKNTELEYLWVDSNLTKTSRECARRTKLAIC